MKILSEPPFLRGSRPSLPFLVTTTMLGSMPLHMFLPALPATARDLATSPGVVQLTITLYMIGMAVGQPIYGPLSDRFGRRPVLMAGLALFIVASIVAAVAETAGTLIAARVFQAFGACAGMTLGRAMVRDGTSTENAAGTMATLGVALTISPAIAPIIGGYLVEWLGWRAVFAALALVCSMVLAIALLTLAETHTQRTRTVGIMPMLRSSSRLARMPQFLGYAMAGSCSASVYAYLAVLPFVLVDALSVPLREVGPYYTAIVVGNAIGSLASNRLVARMGSQRLARIGMHLQLAAALLLLMVHLTGWLSVASFILPATLLAVGIGFTNPNAMVNAISADPAAIGAASGLYGSMQMIFGALCTFVVGVWHGTTILPLAVVLLVSGMLGQAAMAWAERSAKSARP